MSMFCRGRVKEVVEKLMQGQGCANLLKQWLHNSMATHDSVPLIDHEEEEELSTAVFDSFSDALSLIVDVNNSPHNNNSITSDDQTTICMPPHHHSPFSTPSAEITISPPQQQPLFIFKNRKSYGEEREEWWRDDSPTPLYHDGHIWRKYGQKHIKRSKHERSYYRCTYDQVCKAKKHVQKIQDDPSVYRTTYFGQHTCLHHHRLPSLNPILPGVNDDDERFRTETIIRFDQHLHYHQESSSVFPRAFSATNLQDFDTTCDQIDQVFMFEPPHYYYPPSPCTMMFESPAFLDLDDNTFHRF